MELKLYWSIRLTKHTITMHPIHLNINIMSLFTLILLVGLLAVVLLLYCWRRHYTGTYPIEGSTEIATHCVDVRVVIVPVSSSTTKHEEITKVEAQVVIPQDSSKRQAPLWSKIDLGSQHPPIFVDLNSLECM